MPIVTTKPPYILGSIVLENDQGSYSSPSGVFFLRATTTTHRKREGMFREAWK
jgi:hypothetical protein